MAKLVAPKVIESLHQRWTEFCQRLKAKDSDVIWEWIKAAYTEPTRYYHNLNHLYHCFQELDSIPGPHLPEIELALWFHDIEYQTRHSAENELESYQIAINAVGVLGIPNGYLPLMERMILATKDHGAQEMGSYDLMLDIDLSILGQLPEVYQQYEKQIRQEYEWVPLQVYCEARSSILQKFLDSAYIYRTETMRERYEVQARENLKNAIQELQQKAAVNKNT